MTVLSNANESIFIRKAVLSDSNAIYQLMRAVTDSLSNKSLFVCDDLEFVRNTIEKSGFAVVACTPKQQIVGSFLFRYPQDSADNLGRDIGMPDELLSKVVHAESVVVLPEYRGMGLHAKMLAFGESLIDPAHYNCFLTTVSPENPASFRSFEKCGYELVLTKEKYGGLLRRIYKKRLTISCKPPIS